MNGFVGAGGLSAIGWACCSACCERVQLGDSGRRNEGPENAHWTDNDDDQIALTQAEFHLSGAVLEAMRSILIEGADSERATLVAVVRDIFGNPFRLVAFEPRWRTSDTVGVARGTYEDRAFERMPILGDALMDAGCADEQVLEHCRSEGPHVRGCWVVDLVLGKE